MLHAGTCPKCEQGVRGFRTCGCAVLLMCDECEAVWTSPDADEVVFPAQPDLPSPLTGQSLLGASARWCDESEVDAAGWATAIEGEVSSNDTGDTIDPMLTYVGSPGSITDPRLGPYCDAIQADERLQLVESGEESKTAEAVVLAGEPPRLTSEIEVVLQSKKHVLAPLPWGDIIATRELVSLAEEHSRTLAPLLLWPSHPRTASMRSAIDQGVIGPVKRVIIGRSEPDARGLEPLLSEAILVAKWACDTNPTSGSTTSLSADSATVTLDFDTAVALLDISDDLPTRQWIEIVGTRGSLVCDDFFEPPASKETRYWVHDAQGQSTTKTFPPCDGARESLVRLFRQARTGNYDTGENAADAIEITRKLLNIEAAEEQA